MSGFMEWGGDAPEESTPTLNGGNVDRFKAKKGETYRISFAWWPLDEHGNLNLAAKKPRFIGGKVNFIDKVGYILNKGPEYTVLAKGEQPKVKIGTIIVKWPTDKAGNVDQSRLNNGDYSVMPWVFGEARYKVLENSWREWAAGEHDITALCEDEQFQKMTFNPCKNSLLSQILKSPSERHKAFAVDILSRVKELEGKINNEVARDLTLDEIRLKMGTGGPSPVSSPSGMSAGVDDLLGNILDD